MLMFIIQSSDGSSVSGDGHKLTFGQRLVNHLLGLTRPHQRYSVPAEYLCDPEMWGSSQGSQSHLKACRAHSWGNVGSNWFLAKMKGFKSLVKSDHFLGGESSDFCMLPLIGRVLLWQSRFDSGADRRAFNSSGSC